MTALLILSLPVTLSLGAWLAASLDRLVPALWGHATAGPLSALRDAAALMVQQTVTTERPDRLTLLLAPALYLALAAVGLSVVPLSPGLVPVESPVGIVIWGSCEALTIVAVFLHGWSPNAPFPLIGAYRYVAIALPVMLPSMFVLIAAALPAQSLSVTAIVDSQRDTLECRSPAARPAAVPACRPDADPPRPVRLCRRGRSCRGTSAEDSGPGRALWQFARLSMLVAFSAMAAAVFLGGPLGPVLPGPVWLWLKTAAVMALTVLLGHGVARTTPSADARPSLDCSLAGFVPAPRDRRGAGAVTDVLTIVLVVFAIWSGWRVFRTDSMVRASFSLMVSFIAVGGVGVLLSASYIGVATVFMMAVEMMVMAIFMVAFMMNPAGLNPMQMVHQHRISVAAGALAFVGLSAAVLMADLPSDPVPAGKHVVFDLGLELLGPSMLIFETAGVTLLATMVGSVILSSRQGRYGTADEGSRPPGLTEGGEPAGRQPEKSGGHHQGHDHGHGGHSG